MRIALVAGEASGDILGAALIRALRQRFPQATFYGVAGPRMREAGCEAIESIEALSVMGLTEVLRHLPRLLRVRRAVIERFLKDRPDVYIGVDAPDFNLGVERRLRRHGIRAVHMVSPTVWAWRPGRIHGIARSVDLMLCMYPFEPALYHEHKVRAVYVGHPLADELDDSVTPAAARRALGLPEHEPVVAILPGSRGSELQKLAAPFAATAAWLASRRPELRFVVPAASPALRASFEQAIAAHAPQARWHVLDGQSRAAMQAADAVLLASGTATLECLLLGRPMVVGYRVARLTAWLLREAGLLKIDKVSQPNLLCAKPVVPEFLQERATAEHFGPALLELLDSPALREQQLAQFRAVRTELRRDAAARAAEAIGELLGKG